MWKRITNLEVQTYCHDNKVYHHETHWDEQQQAATSDFHERYLVRKVEIVCITISPRYIRYKTIYTYIIIMFHYIRDLSKN